jgi:surface antigen
MVRGILRISINKTKTMPKQKIQKMQKMQTTGPHSFKRLHVLRRKFVQIPNLAMTTVAVMAMIAVPLVKADTYDDQIKTLQSQNAESQSTVSALQAQANSFQDVINNLQIQISALTQQITANQAKQIALQQEITAKQAEIDHEKQVLGDDVKAMYVDGQITTIEQLATSKDLSDFVDKEEYRNAVQKNIQTTLTQITKLQQQLQAQKVEVDKLLSDQNAQESQLAADKAQQNQLLAMNQTQQSAYNAQIKNNSTQISSLRKQQAIENAKLFASNGSRIIAGNNGNDTYPTAWRNASQDSLIDNWGMYNRECVSYTAWKVYASGRHMPYWGGVGNANQWDDNARAAGIPVDSSPRDGDVAIKNSQPYGHAMYVEHVYSDGSIYVSQYNASLDGTYSEAIISAATVRAYSLVFIHFP